MRELYYLQDSRSIVGNSMIFWAKGGRGYTTDISNAEIYTKEKAISQHRSRETDIPWPKDYIDTRTWLVVDYQYTDISTALEGTGIVLDKPERPRKHVSRCGGCQRFLSDQQRYGELCPNCETDNRP